MKKIFGIGLSKTGTTSLSAALNDLGICVTHYPKTKKELFDPQSAGACDIPVVRYYKKLDVVFPNSKFIYTIREKENWLTSIENHLKNKQNNNLKSWQKENRIAVYGQLKFDKDVYSVAYDKYDTEIRAYFKERVEDLLILNICAGTGWEEFLSFIGITSDEYKNFPHRKKAK